MNTRKTYSKGTRKAIVSRIGPRKWMVARGYISELKLSYDQKTCSTQRLAIGFVNDWLQTPSVSQLSTEPT